MSLINDVLQDLDKKPDSENQSILGLMQSAPDTSRRSSVNKLLIVIMALLAAVTVSALYFIYQDMNGDLGVTPLEDVTESAQTSPAVDSSNALPVKGSPAKEGAEKGHSEIENKAEAVVLSKPSPSPERIAEHEQTSAESDSASIVSQEVIIPQIEASAPVTRLKAEPSVSEPSVSEFSKSEFAISEPVKSEHSKSAGAAKIEGLSANPLASNQTKEDSVSRAKQATTHNLPSKNNLLQDHSESNSSGVVAKNKTLNDQRYEAAFKAFQSQKFDASEELIDTLIASSPEPKYLALKARLLLMKSPAALVSYIDQENVDIAASDELLAISANAFQRNGDHVRAVKAYDLMVQRQPIEGRWWLALAFSLEAVALKEKAYKAYSLALQAGTLPATARGYAVVQTNRLKKELDALAQKAKEQE